MKEAPTCDSAPNPSSRFNVGRIVQSIRSFFNPQASSSESESKRQKSEAIFRNAIADFKGNEEAMKNIPTLFQLAKLAMDENNSLPAARTLLDIAIRLEPQDEEEEKMIYEANTILRRL